MLTTAAAAAAIGFHAHTTASIIHQYTPEPGRRDSSSSVLTWGLSCFRFARWIGAKAMSNVIDIFINITAAVSCDVLYRHQVTTSFGSRFGGHQGLWHSNNHQSLFEKGSMIARPPRWRLLVDSNQPSSGFSFMLILFFFFSLLLLRLYNHKRWMQPAAATTTRRRKSSHNSPVRLQQSTTTTTPIGNAKTKQEQQQEQQQNQ